MLANHKKAPLKPIPKEEALEAVISRRSFINLHDISHLRLDRENIKVFNLDLEKYNNITHLYLQQNLLKDIVLSSQNLSFLSLSNNAISNLKLNTPALLVLDLENNLITQLDDLFQNLEFLNLKGNPVTNKIGYRSEMLNKFRNLKELDGIQLPSYEKSIKEEDVQQETRAVNYKERVQQILKRSRDRQSETRAKRELI
jgi:hypothetical protein